MEAVILIITLFFPAIWRALLSWAFPTGIHAAGRLSAWSIPIVVVGANLAGLGLSAGAYGLFIPFLLVTFWLPQIAVIAFFIWCEREQATRSDKETQSHRTDTQ